MLNSLFLAFLLPSYPLSEIPDVPNNVIIAQSLEYEDPHKCIAINQNYLDYLYRESNYKKAFHFSNRIFALNSMISCQINAGYLKDAENNLIIIKIIENHDYHPYTKLFTAISEIKLNIALGNKVTNIDKLRQYIPKENLNNFKPSTSDIITIYSNAIKLNQKDYLTVYNNIQKILEDSDFSKNHEDFFYVPTYALAYHLHNKFGEQFQAEEIIQKLDDYLKQSKYKYLKAQIFKKLARNAFNYQQYSQAVYDQETAINIIEKIPEEQKNYIDDLFDLMEYDLAAGNQAKALLICVKLEQIINNLYKDSITYNKQLANSYLKLKNYKKALVYFEKTNANLAVNPNNPSTIEVALNYAVANIGSNRVNVANQIIDNIAPLYPNLSQDNKNKYDYVLANLEAAKNNYKKAFNDLLKIPYVNYRIDNNPINNNVTNNVERFILQQKNYKTEDIITKYLPIHLDDLKSIAISITGALFLFLFLIISRLSNRNKEINEKLQKYQETDYFTTDNAESNFLSYIIFLNNELEEIKRSKKKFLGNVLSREKQIFHFYIPGFNSLNMKIGSEHTTQLLNIFREKLRSSTNEQYDLFTIQNDRFILCKNISFEKTCFEECDKLTQIITNILTDIQVNSKIVMGVIEYPFTPHSSIHMKASKFYEVSLLALAGAMTVYERDNTSFWLKLNPNNVNADTLQLSDVRQTVLNEIKKGNIKVQTMDHSREIDWLKISNSSLY